MVRSTRVWPLILTILSPVRNLPSLSTNQRSVSRISTNHSSPRHHAAGVDVGDGEALGLAAAGAARDDHSQALLARLEHCQLLNIEIR